MTLVVQLDGTEVWRRENIVQAEHVSIDVSEDEDGDHSLCWIVSGKQPHYTVVDQQGNIVSDSMLRINNFTVDDIDLTGYLDQIATYSHDFNGNGALTVEKMYPDLGCNGTAEMKFSTPLYMWILENI